MVTSQSGTYITSRHRAEFIAVFGVWYNRSAMSTAPTGPVPVPATAPTPTAAATAPAIAATRKPSCNPLPLYDSLTEVFREIQQQRNKPLFALVADYIDVNVLNEVFTWRKELRSAGTGLSFDVLIHSPGGQLTASYMLARLLSRFTNQWEALVPQSAGSGATLICLGSSNILMSEIAQLGPMDPQVASKKREKFFATERQSPLEAFEALRNLREFAASSLDALMEVLTDRGIAPQRALETSTSIATDLVKPVLEKIDPYDLGAFSLDNKLALNYCSEVARPSDVNKRTQRRALYKSIVEDYPVHEFAIDFEEAQAIRFAVTLPEADLEDIFDKFRVRVGRLSPMSVWSPQPKRHDMTHCDSSKQEIPSKKSENDLRAILKRSDEKVKDIFEKHDLEGRKPATASPEREHETGG